MSHFYLGNGQLIYRSFLLLPDIYRIHPFSNIKQCFRKGSPKFHALEKILKFRGFRQTLRSFAVIVPNALFLTLTLELAENSLGTIGIKAWKPTCPIFVQLFSDCPTQILGRCFHGYNFLENSENFDFLSLWSEKSRSMFHCPINCPVPCSVPHRDLLDLIKIKIGSC